MRQISLTTLPRLSRNCKRNTKCLQFTLFFRKKSVKMVSTVSEFLQEPLDMVSVRCGMMAGNRQWEHRFPVPFEELPRLHRREIVGPIFIAVDTKAGKGNPGNTGNRIRVFRRHQICAVIASQCSGLPWQSPVERNQVTITTKIAILSYSVGQSSNILPLTGGLPRPVCALVSQ